MIISARLLAACMSYRRYTDLMVSKITPDDSKRYYCLTQPMPKPSKHTKYIQYSWCSYSRHIALAYIIAHRLCAKTTYQLQVIDINTNIQVRLVRVLVAIICIATTIIESANICTEFSPGQCLLCPSTSAYAANSSNPECYAFTKAALEERLLACPYSVWGKAPTVGRPFSTNEFAVLVQRLLDGQEAGFLNMLSYDIGTECPIWLNGSYTRMPCPFHRPSYPVDVSCDTHCCQLDQLLPAGVVHTKYLGGCE